MPRGRQRAQVCRPGYFVRRFMRTASVNGDTSPFGSSPLHEDVSIYVKHLVPAPAITATTRPPIKGVISVARQDNY